MSHGGDDADKLVTIEELPADILYLAEDITSLLSTVGIEADDSRIKSLLAEVEGKDINELIAEGTTKLGSVPSGGAAAAPSAGGAAAAGGAPAAEEKVEEKAEEKEESDEDMGFGLFD